jgi:hypothetical protein
VVIGETSVIGNDCSIAHAVTLGGTGKEGGDRHPKLGNGGEIIMICGMICSMYNYVLFDGKVYCINLFVVVNTMVLK